MTTFTDNTKAGGGSVTTPGAGVVIASVAAPAEGTYRACIVVHLNGTAETLLRNLRLRENGATVADLSSTPGSATYIIERFEVNQGGGNVDVVAIGLATAGAIYTVQILLTRIG